MGFQVPASPRSYARASCRSLRSSAQTPRCPVAHLCYAAVGRAAFESCSRICATTLELITGSYGSAPPISSTVYGFSMPTPGAGAALIAAESASSCSPRVGMGAGRVPNSVLRNAGSSFTVMHGAKDETTRHHHIPLAGVTSNSDFFWLRSERQSAVQHEDSSRLPHRSQVGTDPV
jgi:hypothetical protein